MTWCHPRPSGAERGLADATAVALDAPLALVERAEGVLAKIALISDPAALAVGQVEHAKDTAHTKASEKHARARTRA